MIIQEKRQMSKCFGICRVSTESQSNNTSLEHQKESIMKYSEYWIFGVFYFPPINVTNPI